MCAEALSPAAARSVFEHASESLKRSQVHVQISAFRVVCMHLIGANKNTGCSMEWSAQRILWPAGSEGLERPVNIVPFQALAMLRLQPLSLMCAWPESVASLTLTFLEESDVARLNVARPGFLSRRK